MLRATDTREIVSLEVLGHRLSGTYHRPPGDGIVSWTSGLCASAPAVLILNSLALPRASTGDSAVYWAESFARSGYPTFRFDLPGLGDSDGHTSTDLLDFINDGGFAAAAVGIANELVGRGGFPGVVFVGHCAGAVTANYAAASFKKCKGLIMLDPYFHLPILKRPKSREKLSDWARRSKLGRPMSNLFDRAKRVRLILRGANLPSNANTKLIGKWKEVSAAGLPMLVFKAPGIKAKGSKPRVGEFDYMGYVAKLAGRKSDLVIKAIENADHSFANRAGREAIVEATLAWLASHFPVASAGAFAHTDSLPDRGITVNSLTNTRVAPPNPDCALGGR
jgi:pimeloyl-ACP methyl ester carboxylesterase